MPYRIVSLVPSVTELLFDLGLGSFVVGRTGFCVHPREAVAAVPKVGGTKSVNIKRIRQLQPTHVILNMDENRAEDAETLRAFVPELVVTHPCSPQDNLSLIGQMANTFAAHPPVRALATQWSNRMGAALDALRATPWPARRALYLIWREPWMTVARDTYISRMLALAGWQTLPDTMGGAHGSARYPVVRLDEPWLASVDDVFLSSEPYAFGGTDAAELRKLMPHARVRLVDGEMLSWYGSRAVAGLGYLARLAGQGTADQSPL